MNIKLPLTYIKRLARNQHGCIVGYARDSQGQIDGLITLELFVADDVLMTTAPGPMDTVYSGVGSPTHSKFWKLVDLPGSPLEQAIDFNGMLIALDRNAQ